MLPSAVLLKRWLEVGSSTRKRSFTKLSARSRRDRGHSSLRTCMCAPTSVAMAARKSATFLGNCVNFVNEYIAAVMEVAAPTRPFTKAQPYEAQSSMCGKIFAGISWWTLSKR